MIPSNPKTGKAKWLEMGYKHFAYYGPESLSVNKLSRDTDTSRASFYHHFGDISVFIDELLTMHWHIIDCFNKMGKKKCQNLYPDLYELIAEHPVSHLFTMQLFHARSTPEFNYIFIKTYEAIANAFALNLFAREYQLNPIESEVFNLWLTVGETWYSRLTPQDLSAPSLQKHAEEIMKTISSFMNSQLYTTLRETK